MTDKEIEKALNICGNLDSDACNECPIDGKIKDDCQCGTYLAKNALDYINRLKAKNEQMKKALQTLYKIGNADNLCGLPNENKGFVSITLIKAWMLECGIEVEE